MLSNQLYYPMEKEDPLNFTPTQALLEKINRKEELVYETGAGVAEPGQSIRLGAVCAGLKIPSRRGTWVRIPPPAPRLCAL